MEGLLETSVGKGWEERKGDADIKGGERLQLLCGSALSPAHCSALSLPAGHCLGVPGPARLVLAQLATHQIPLFIQ